MTSPAQCLVLVPVASHIEPETGDCLSRLIERGYRVQTLRGCSEVSLARSSLASDAIRAGATETMWIDSDIVFDPADVDRLRAHGRPFTAGLYVRKKAGAGFAAKFRPGTEAVKFGREGGLLEVEYVGFGFCHVRAEVYREMRGGLKLPDCLGGYDPAKPICPFFIPTVIPAGEGWEYLSEDSAFCWRARQVGFPCFADTTVRLGHVGSHRYSWEDLAERQRFDGLEIGIRQP